MATLNLAVPRDRFTNPSAAFPTVLLAEDHTLVAAGLAKLVEDQVDLIGTVEDGRALVAAVRKQRPDVILLDISMPVLNGLEAVRQVRIDSPSTKIVFVTVHSDWSYVVEAFRAGASGYLLKRSAASELPTAIQEVLQGRSYVTPLIPKNMMDGVLTGKQGQPLTSRQREVLQLVAEGHSAKEIAASLRISSKTVEFHKALIMKRLNRHSVAELTRYALEHRMAEDKQRGLHVV